MTPEEEVRRAGKAKELLENELFKEAVTEVEENIRSARLQSAASAVDLREKLWAQELALHTVLGNLRTHIETGELAKRTLLDRAKEFFQQ